MHDYRKECTLRCESSHDSSVLFIHSLKNFLFEFHVTICELVSESEVVQLPGVQGQIECMVICPLPMSSMACWECCLKADWLIILEGWT